MLLGLAAVIAVAVWKFGSLQRTVTDMDNHVKTITDPSLTLLKTIIDQINTDLRTTSANIQALSSHVTSEIGSDVKTASASVQGLRDLVTSVGQNVAPIMPVVKDITARLERVDTMDKRAEETERYIKNLYFAFVGSQSKGKMGEKALENIMAHLIKAGQVKTDQKIGSGRVEYVMVFNDGKMLPIDCKMAGCEEVIHLHDEDLKPEDKADLVKEVRKKVRANIPKVQEYIEPTATLPMAVMAVPDGVMEHVDDIVPEAQERNVILLGYSAVPQLMGYFMRIHAFYAIKEGIQPLQEKMSWARQQLSMFDEKFFQKHFVNPLSSLEDGANVVKGTISEVKAGLSLDGGPRRPDSST
jgi:uncharacterized protein YoxC